MDPTNCDSPEYQAHYDHVCRRMAYVVESLGERPSRAIELAVEAGGEVALQALFAAVSDHGEKAALLRALNSPKLAGWVRERLESFLYGSGRPLARSPVKRLA
jgi:hypothetical protein